MATDMKQKPPPPNVPMKPETQVAKRGEVAPAMISPPDLEEVMKARMSEVSRKDFYKVSSKKNDDGKWEDVLAPNARVLQKWANDNDGHPICTKILETVETKDGCSVKVRGWIGDEAKPLTQHDEVVSMLWIHELEFLLTEAVAKGIKLPKRDGSWGTETVKPPFNVEYDDVTGISRIVLTNPEHQLHVLAEWVRLKRFGLRSCVTKAQSRIFRKLLGGEWRDEEEIQIEKSDVQAVADSKGIGHAEDPADKPAAPPPANTERLIPEGKKAEQKNGGVVSPIAITSLVTRFKDLGDKFPGGTGELFDHREYLTFCALGLMFERGASITEPKIEAMSGEDAGKLWQFVGAVAHGDEQALIALDNLNAAGKKVAAALNKRGKQ